MNHDVKAIRSRLKLTQNDVAQVLGVHEQTVSKWERGAAVPSQFQETLLDMLAKTPKKVARGLHEQVKRYGATAILTTKFGLK